MMHLRQGEVTQENNFGEPSRATTPGSYIRPARRRAELRSLVRQISISLRFKRVAQPGPWTGKPRVGRDGDYLNLLSPTLIYYHFLKHLAKVPQPNLHLRRAFRSPRWRAPSKCPSRRLTGGKVTVKSAARSSVLLKTLPLTATSGEAREHLWRVSLPNSVQSRSFMVCVSHRGCRVRFDRSAAMTKMTKMTHYRRSFTRGIQGWRLMPQSIGPHSNATRKF